MLDSGQQRIFQQQFEVKQFGQQRFFIQQGEQQLQLQLQQIKLLLQQFFIKQVQLVIFQQLQFFIWCYCLHDRRGI